MAIFSWSFRRQLGVIAILAFFVFLLAGGGIYYFYPEQTCFDNKKNQNEERVDCGGSCVPCAEQIRDFSVLWTRFFKIREEGAYDIAALVENRNQFYAATRLRYAIKLYDKDNVLISVKEGGTFANAGERFIIFEPNFAVRNRVPARAIVEFREVSWISKEARPLPIDILKKDIFFRETSPKVDAEIKNASSGVFRNIEATAVLYDSSEESVGASRTTVEKLDIQESAKIFFTWPMPIPQANSVEIYLRNAP